MVKRKPLQQLFEGKSLSGNNSPKGNYKKSPAEEKNEIEAYLKKIQDKLKNDPQAQKKAAMIISLMLGDESQQKSNTKKAI